MASQAPSSLFADDTLDFLENSCDADELKKPTVPWDQELVKFAMFKSKAPKLGRLTLLRKIGEGAMGMVYAAYDEELDRRVAIKILRPELSGKYAGRERLLREAQAMARLSHPNVVVIHDVGTHEGHVFIVMEFIKGMSLRQWLMQPRSLDAILDAFMQAGQGLAAAHEVGLIHRDFKPDNVLMGQDGRIRVVDFGLVLREEGRSAVSLTQMVDPQMRRASKDSLSQKITQMGTVLGTPAYMSPEQFLGKAVDIRSDQFSFCVAMYEAVYGKKPFTGHTFLELQQQVTTELSELPKASHVPEWLRKILQRGLALNPENRYLSMGQLLEEIRQHRQPNLGFHRSKIILFAVLAVLLLGTTSMFLWAYYNHSALEAQSNPTQVLVAEANEAGANAAWVYPFLDTPFTSYQRVLDLEALSADGNELAQTQAQTLRKQFSQALARLGEEYWDLEVTRPFARDFYLQALLFSPEDEFLSARAGVTRGEFLQLQALAKTGQFSKEELQAAIILQILATPQLAQRIEGLKHLQQRHGDSRALRNVYMADLIAGLEQKIPTADEPSTNSKQQIAATNLNNSLLDLPQNEEPLPESVFPPLSSKEDTTSPEQELAEEVQKQSKDEPTTSEKPTEQSRRMQSRNLAKLAQSKSQTNLKEAEAMYHQALAYDPQNATALMGLSDIYFELGQRTKALEYAHEAVNLVPKDGLFRIRLGDAYFKLLRYPSAQEQYEEALRLGHPLAKQRLQRLAKTLATPCPKEDPECNDSTATTSQ